jgi:hypothetical protein
LADGIGEDMNVAPGSAFRFDAKIRTSAWDDVLGHGIRQRQRSLSRPNGLAFHPSVTVVSVKKALMKWRKSNVTPTRIGHARQIPCGCSAVAMSVRGCR